MPDTKAQSYANHTKWDPLFHFFLAPILIANLIVCIVHVIRYPSLAAGWIVVLAIAAPVFLLRMRIYALRVQDRVIRLEERQRLSQLLSDPTRARIGELTEAQLIAIRFASDPEVPGLVASTLANGQKAADIKKSIKTWRPDHFRV